MLKMEFFMNTLKKLSLFAFVMMNALQSPAMASNECINQECIPYEESRYDYEQRVAGEFIVALRKTKLMYYDKVATLLEQYCCEKSYYHVEVTATITDPTLSLVEKADMIDGFVTRYNENKQIKKDKAKSKAKKEAKLAKKANQLFYENRMKEGKAFITRIFLGFTAAIAIENVLHYYLDIKR
jgi:hypothetical protein